MTHFPRAGRLRALTAVACTATVPSPRPGTPGRTRRGRTAACATSTTSPSPRRSTHLPRTSRPRCAPRPRSVDAFADLVVTGRIPAPDLARAMATVAPVCAPSRWSSSLAEAARAPGGAPAVIGVLTALLPQLDPDTHGLHAPLETLQETSLRDGIALRDERLRAWLATVGGSGKAARTARRLLG